jgi:hypothetical protein
MSAPSATRARVLVVALALLCVTAGWLAGRMMAPAAAPARTRGYLEQLTAAVDLRPDQVAAVERVLSEEDRDLDALLQRGLDGIKGEVATRRARTEQEVLAVLDAGQRDRYQSLSTGSR